MTYHQFVQAVELKVRETVGKGLSVSVCKTQRNNGIFRTGLVISEPGVNISPAIYLEEYYRQLQIGESVETVAEDILRLYYNMRFQKPWEAKQMYTYEEVKDQIVYRLIQRRTNADRLKNVPYIPYLDLAVIFYVMVGQSSHGMAAMMVQNTHLALWGITREELYERAGKNTPRKLPWEFQTMEAVLEEMEAAHGWKEEDIMYILSNKSRCFGASAMLYDGTLKRIGDLLGENYYVLPSSVHEVIVVPEGDAPCRELLDEMVLEVNETCVDPEEVLCDHAYYYDREFERLCI